MAQRIEIVSIFVTAGNRQHPGTQDINFAMDTFSVNSPILFLHNLWFP
jgi:hypothetical protein